jgi:hypothetical protein
MKLSPDIRHQNGASLLIGMILLLAISLLSLVGARSSLSQYKSLQASLDYQQTFLAADSALGKSSHWLLENIQNKICNNECNAINGVNEIDALPDRIYRKGSEWWQQNAEPWHGGRRLIYLSSSESILLLNEASGIWDEYQREIYSSYFFQTGTLPGNRVLLHELWLVDRPFSANQNPLFNNCKNGFSLRTALLEDLAGLCGRLGWEQVIP